MMKRTTLFVVVASAFSLPLSALANSDTSSSAEQSTWGQSTQRVESMNDQQGVDHSQSSQSSDVIKQAQEKLSSLGKDVGTPDGQMNSQTRQALEEFQQENGLQPSGQLDSQTLAALEIDQSSAASGGSSSATPSSESSSSVTPSTPSSESSSSGSSSSESPSSTY